MARRIRALHDYAPTGEGQIALKASVTVRTKQWNNRISFCTLDTTTNKARNHGWIGNAFNENYRNEEIATIVKEGVCAAVGRGARQHIAHIVSIS